MTTSIKKPGTAERIARNMAIIEINYELELVRPDKLELMEEKLERPSFLTWLSFILNRRSQRTRMHYFYNQELKTLDYYVMTDPPTPGGSQHESEEENATP